MHAAGTTCAASPHCFAYTAADDFYTDARWFSSTEETRTLDAIGDRVPLKAYGEGLGRTAGAIYLGDPDAALDEAITTAGAYFETATFVVTVGEGAGAARKFLSGAGSGAVRLAQVGRAKVGCFVAGTEVLLCDGTTVPIESLQQGDEVQAFDHDTGQWVCAPVLATSVREVDVVVDLEVDPDGAGPMAAFTLTGTLEHPFFVPVRGEYVAMAELRAGDGLRREDGGEAVVVGVEVRAVRVEVFNLEVGEVHDYHVLASATAGPALLVHNFPCPRRIKIRFIDGMKFSFTEPDLPDKLVANEVGVTIEHFYRSGDHGPPHLHVRGEGTKTRIGQNGHPLDNDPEPSTLQQEVINNNLRDIRRTIKKIGRWKFFEDL